MATTAILPATLEIPQRVVTSPDPDGSTLTQYAVPNLAQLIRVGAFCNTASATLSLTVYLINSANLPYGVETVTFTAGATADWSTDYTGTVSGTDPVWPLGGAKFVAIKVNSVSGGSWTINAALG